MTNVRTSIVVRLVTLGVFACVVNSSLLFSAAQTRTARIATRSPAASSVKNPRRATAVDAEQMLSLFKRDGNRPLLVNFWATWCDLCREEFPDLVKIDSDYRARGLEFIAITLDDLADIKTAVPKFLRQKKAMMPVYLLNVPDPDPAIHSVDAGWSGALPATFLYNNKGEVVYKQLGRIKPDELRAAIDKLVNEKQKAEGNKQ